MPIGTLLKALSRGRGTGSLTHSVTPGWWADSELLKCRTTLCRWHPIIILSRKAAPIWLRGSFYPPVVRGEVFLFHVQRIPAD